MANPISSNEAIREIAKRILAESHLSLRSHEQATRMSQIDWRDGVVDFDFFVTFNENINAILTIELRYDDRRNEGKSLTKSKHHYTVAVQLSCVGIFNASPEDVAVVLESYRKLTALGLAVKGLFVNREISDPIVNATSHAK